MAATVGKDIVFRATIKNDTASGAAQARAELRAWGEEIQRDSATRAVAMANNEKKAKADVLKWEQEYSKRTVQDTTQTAAQAAEKQRKNEVQSRIELRQWEESRAAAAAAERESEIVALEGRLKAAGGEEGWGRGGEGGMGRVLRDQRTTGLDPLTRGLVGGLEESKALMVGLVAVGTAALNHLTESAAQFSDELERGHLSTAGAVLELGKQVPILSSVISAGQNIREIFTGEKVELERQLNFTEAIVEAGDRQYATALKNLETQRQYSNELRQMDRETAGIGLRGTSAEVHAINTNADNRIDALNSDIKDAGTDASIDAIGDKDQQALQKFRDDNGMRMTELRDADNEDKKSVVNSYLPKWYVNLYSSAQDKELQKLEAQEKALDDKAKIAGEQRTARRNQRIAKDQAAIKKTEDQRKKSQDEVQKKRGERLKLEGESAGATHENSASLTAAEQERTSGRVYESQKIEIDTQQKRQEADARMSAESRTNATDNAEERKRIAQELAMQLQDIENKSNAARATLAKAHNIESKRIQYDATQSTLDAQVAANAQRLREAGEGYAARAELDQRAHEKRLADIDRQAAEEIARNSNNATAIRAKAAADKAKENADFKEQQRQAGEDQRKGQFQIARDLIAGQVDALKSDASMGNVAAAMKAKQLEIHQQFAEKREHLTDIMKDTHATQAERDAAKKQFAGLDKQESNAEKLAFFSGGYSIPGMTISARGSGAGERAREEASAPAQLAKLVRDGNRDVNRTAKATEELVALLRKNPVLAPLLKGF